MDLMVIGFRQTGDFSGVDHKVSQQLSLLKSYSRDENVTGRLYSRIALEPRLR